MEDSGIDDVRERLYARRRDLEEKKIAPKKISENPLPKTWRDPQESAPMRTPSPSWTRHFFTGSLVFFVVALIAAGTIFLFGGRVVSPDRILVSIDGPSVVGGGEELVLSIRIGNRNPVPVEYGELTVTFPEGTRSSEDRTEPLPRITEDVGALRPGESKDVTVRAVVFAQEGSTITLPMSFEYRTEGSNASVIKETSYEFLVSNSPVTLTLSGDTTVVSGDEVTIKAVVRGNSKESIENAGILFSFPFGFSVTRTIPSSSDGRLFELGRLRSGEERTITITGVLLGSEGEKRVVRAATGLVSGDDLSITYTENTHAIAIVDPLLGIDVAINGERKDQHTSSPGERIIGSLAWENDLDTRVFDGEIRIAFSGTGFKDIVSQGEGNYSASSQTLVFTRDTNPELATIEPGEKGTISFSFVLKDSDELSFADRPLVQLKSSMIGKININRAVDTISSSYSTRILLAPAVSVDVYARYSDGPFVNSGPMPPRAGDETLYTVTATLRGGSSALADATLSATLPSYARFVGTKDPSGADITINELTDELVWSAGELSAGSTKTVSFQIGITPFSTHVNRSIPLLEGVVVSGFDRFTQESVRQSTGSVTTVIVNDSSYQESWGVISE